jgi:hypothetical protein
MQSQMPEESKGLRSLRLANLNDPYSWSSRMADARPGGNVRVDPSWMNKNQSEIDDTLAHELTHVDQFRRSGLLDSLRMMSEQLLPYDARPSEKEAFAVTRRRRNNRVDRVLPKE